MSNALDLSLDALIEQNKSKKSRVDSGDHAGRRGSGRSPRGVSKRSPQGRSPHRSGRSHRGLANTERTVVYDHDDRFTANYMNGAIAEARPRAVQLDAGNKILVQNLHYNVVEKDLVDLFSEIGPLRKANLLFDATGRSSGTGEVIFQRGEDALAAIAQYNGVTLDGRPMRIDLVSRPNLGSAVVSYAASGSDRRGHGPRRTSPQRKGGRAQGRQQAPRERAGRPPKDKSAAPVAKTQDDLDNEMDSYMNAKLGGNDVDPTSETAQTDVLPASSPTAAVEKGDLDGDISMS